MLYKIWSAYQNKHRFWWVDISGIYLSCSLGTQYLTGSAQSGSADELMEAHGLAAGKGASLPSVQLQNPTRKTTSAASSSYHSKCKVKLLLLLPMHKVFDFKKEKNPNISAVLHKSVDEVHKTKFSLYIYSIFVASESKLWVSEASQGT